MTPQQIEAMKLALEALKNNKRTHLYCEDIWYSCPKHEDGCANEAEGDECNCGADDVNAQFDQAIIALEEALAQPEQIQASADSNTHQLERHELQAKGEHPAPCARHCEANAFQIVIKNLKAQLAQPEQEPVIDKSAAIRIATSLGWTPQRKPLTQDGTMEIANQTAGQYWMDEAHIQRFRAAVEAFHGIKENT